MTCAAPPYAFAHVEPLRRGRVADHARRISSQFEYARATDSTEARARPRFSGRSRLNRALGGRRARPRDQCRATREGPGISGAFYAVRLSKMAAPWPPAERAWLKTAAEGLPQEAFERVVAAAFGRDVAALRRWAVEDVFAGVRGLFFSLCFLPSLSLSSSSTTTTTSGCCGAFFMFYLCKSVAQCAKCGHFYFSIQKYAKRKRMKKM